MKKGRGSAVLGVAVWDWLRYVDGLMRASLSGDAVCVVGVCLSSLYLVMQHACFVSLLWSDRRISPCSGECFVRRL